MAVAQAYKTQTILFKIQSERTKFTWTNKQTLLVPDLPRQQIGGHLVRLDMGMLRIASTLKVPIDHILQQQHRVLPPQKPGHENGV